MRFSFSFYAVLFIKTLNFWVFPHISSPLDSSQCWINALNYSCTHRISAWRGYNSSHLVVIIFSVGNDDFTARRGRPATNDCLPFCRPLKRKCFPAYAGMQGYKHFFIIIRNLIHNRNMLVQVRSNRFKARLTLD